VSTALCNGIMRLATHVHMTRIISSSIQAFGSGCTTVHLGPHALTHAVEVVLGEKNSGIVLILE